MEPGCYTVQRLTAVVLSATWQVMCAEALRGVPVAVQSYEGISVDNVMPDPINREPWN
jgi:hypothetical protein